MDQKKGVSAGVAMTCLATAIGIAPNLSSSTRWTLVALLLLLAVAVVVWGWQSSRARLAHGLTLEPGYPRFTGQATVFVIKVQSRVDHGITLSADSPVRVSLAEVMQEQEGEKRTIKLLPCPVDKTPEKWALMFTNVSPAGKLIPTTLRFELSRSAEINGKRGRPHLVRVNPISFSDEPPY